MNHITFTIAKQLLQDKLDKALSEIKPQSNGLSSKHHAKYYAKEKEIKAIN